MILRFILWLCHLIGGDAFRLKIMITASMPFFEYIQVWPTDAPAVQVLIFAHNEFMLKSCMASWREDDHQTDPLS